MPLNSEGTQGLITHIPFLLQTFLSLSYLLHNSMSKEVFGEASKFRNKKQEARRKKKILDLRDWGMEAVPPRRGGGETIALPPHPRPQENIRKVCYC